MKTWLFLTVLLIVTSCTVIQETSPYVEEIPDTEVPQQSYEPDVGDFKVVYSPTDNPAYQRLQGTFKEANLFEKEADTQNNYFILPQDVTIILTECEEVNAFYEDGQITICYELIEYTRNLFNKKLDITPGKADEGMFYTTLFFLYHELGHALIDIYDLPVLGGEEDAADRISIYALINAGERGEKALLWAVDFFDLESSKKDYAEVHDVHGLDKQRYYNILCLIYGENPSKEYIITEWGLPLERARVCVGEYIRLSNSVDRSLAPYIKAVPGMPEKVDVNIEINLPDIEVNLPETIPENLDCVARGCDPGTILIGSKASTSKIYHECHCRYAKVIKKENLWCFTSVEEAEAEGYRPAESC